MNIEIAKGFQQWQLEVELLGRLSHPNILKLLGFCCEDHEILLVYEFMPKGSLKAYLSRSPAIQPLTWDMRLKISIGAARALAFLHASEISGIDKGWTGSLCAMSLLDSGVYGFGVVLAGMLTGEEIRDHMFEIGGKPLKFAKERMDPRLEGKFPLKATAKMVQLSQLCRQQDSKRRPSMERVVQILEGIEKLQNS